LTHTLSVERRFKLYFVIEYLAVGIFGPYLALYLTAKGLTGVQLGLILGSIPLVTIFAQPLWGFLSDLFRARRPLLVLACVLTALIAISFYWFNTIELLLPIFILYAVFHAPLGLLGTALALDYLEEVGQLEDFGALRLWGSIGFAVTALLAGSLFITSLIQVLPMIYGGLMLLLALVVLTLPESPPPPPQERAPWWSTLRQLRGQTPLLTYLVGVLFIGATMEVGMQYLAVYLNLLQAPGWIIGSALALQAILEVPLMSNVAHWIRRWGLALVLMSGVILLPVRWLLYIFIEEPLLVIPTQVLHSMAIVSLMVVGVAFVDRQMPKRLRATGQGLYSTIMNGIGPAIGLFVAGIAYEARGIRAVWSINTVVALVGVAILWFTFSVVIPRQAAEEH
jgi:MFS family permease